MRERWPNKRKDWNPKKSEALDLLACESLILQFLKQLNDEDDLDPITKRNLQEFWEYIQKRKDDLNTKREQ